MARIGCASVVVGGHVILWLSVMNIVPVPRIAVVAKTTERVKSFQNFGEIFVASQMSTRLYASCIIWLIGLGLKFRNEKNTSISL